MEVEEPSGPPRGLLLGLGVVGLVLAGAVASLFVFRLQPPLGGGITCASGTSCVSMPANASALNFSPSNITVIQGVNSTIVWSNQDTVQHTVVVCPIGGGQICAPSKALASSGFLSKGDTFQVTLNSTGVYHFFCSIHPGIMRGTIVVKAGAAASAST
jgi:plastocyanin